MARLLAIDYGKKRTGLAVSDEMQIIAGGLTTVPTTELLDFLLGYVSREPVERIIVGLPKQMNNEPSENMRYWLIGSANGGEVIVKKVDYELKA